tara:strand:- start:257 stop:460 length:204 start_codon:yes stop_codon:yes gene_type:complete
MSDLIKHCNCLPQQKSKEFGDHSPYCVYIVLAKMQEKIEKLEAGYAEISEILDYAEPDLERISYIVR